MAVDAQGRLAAFAAAKINLTLRVGQRRPDGYHDIESLVVFADLGDALLFTLGETLRLSTGGETAADAGDIAGNLVLKAARALLSDAVDLRVGHFHLTKRLPVAAGLGGGSSDAAAALRLLAEVNGIPIGDSLLMAAARKTGADVPVCLDPRPRIMRGIGDVLSAPLGLPPLYAVLVNPRIPVPTAQVFAARADNSVMREAPAPHRDPASVLVETTATPAAIDLIAAVAESSNDLEAPALALFPPIGDVLTALRTAKGCMLARMSGSGGTCFGLFGSAAAADTAARELEHARPQWWIRAAMLGPGAPR